MAAVGPIQIVADVGLTVKPGPGGGVPGVGRQRAEARELEGLVVGGADQGGLRRADRDQPVEEETGVDGPRAAARHIVAGSRIDDQRAGRDRAARGVHQHDAGGVEAAGAGVGVVDADLGRSGHRAARQAEAVGGDGRGAVGLGGDAEVGVHEQGASARAHEGRAAAGAGHHDAVVGLTVRGGPGVEAAEEDRAGVVEGFKARDGEGRGPRRLAGH